MRSRLVLLELNEINFDVVGEYMGNEPGRWPAFERLKSCLSRRTTSESDYKCLEPWIQWPSVHMGLSFGEHGIFRLGDAVDSSWPQIFEKVEALGWRVGAISPMNAANRLKNPAYFIPDPWTRTESDRSWWSRSLAAAISQGVNDNAESRVTPGSAGVLALGLLRFSRIKNYSKYLHLIAGSRKAPWRRALALDLFLHDLHMTLFGQKGARFSTLFLNAGAHIQHHYFFNSPPVIRGTRCSNPSWYVAPGVDPVGEMLDVYDGILSDYLALEDAEFIVATGLSQRPYDGVKFYYRLRQHESFLRKLGIHFNEVLPRMTRDFEILFDDAASASRAAVTLSGLRNVRNQVPIFGEIDNRGCSLFVTLTYPHEVVDSDVVQGGDEEISLARHVVFVAIKNGMHQERGFAFFSEGMRGHAPAEDAHVKELHGSLLSFCRERQEVSP